MSSDLVVAITGASGSIYGVRLLEVLLAAGRRVHLVISPAGRLASLFDRLHDLTDPAEVVRQSALHDVDFLPPGSVPGAD